MRSSIEIYIYVLIILFVIVVLVSFITTTLVMTSARNIHSVALHRVEASNGHPDVVSKLRNGEGITSNPLPRMFGVEVNEKTLYDGRLQYEVVVNYSYSLPFFSMFSEKVKIENRVIGYARVVKVQ